MSTTKKKISEQVQRMLKGNPIISARVHINDIKLLIEQVSNQLLKTDYFQVNMPEGMGVPPAPEEADGAGEEELPPPR